MFYASENQCFIGNTRSLGEVLSYHCSQWNKQKIQTMEEK
jgi:hypothetical protein